MIFPIFHTYRIGIAVFVLLISIPVHAQSGRSWMNGLVLDESDTDGVEYANVELIGDPNNERLKNLKLSTKTASTGKYSFDRVPYGEYTFRVSAPGFATYQIHLYLASDAQTQVHVKLLKKKSG